MAFKVLSDGSDSSSAVDEETINDTLTVDQLVAVHGGESGKDLTKGYVFIPETSGNYYLESDAFRDYSYAIYDSSTGIYDYSPNLKMQCVLKEDAIAVTVPQKMS